MTDHTGTTVERGPTADVDVTAGDATESADDEGTSGFEPTGSQGDSLETGAEQDEPTQLPLNQTFEILRNQRRRYVLQYLDETEGQVSLGELAEHIAAWENDKDVSQISSSERKRVYVGLYQCHLPKMDGMDVVSFNKPRGNIEEGEHAEWVKQYLDREDDAEDAEVNTPAVGATVLGICALPVAVLLAGGSPGALVVTALLVAVLTAAAVLQLR